MESLIKDYRFINILSNVASFSANGEDHVKTKTFIFSVILFKKYKFGIKNFCIQQSTTEGSWRKDKEGMGTTVEALLREWKHSYP